VGSGGEVFLLKMGQPIKIVNLSIDLIRLLGGMNRKLILRSTAPACGRGGQLSGQSGGVVGDRAVFGEIGCFAPASPSCPLELFRRERKMTRKLKYVVYQEDRFYVSQCLNVDVASFGETIDEAVQNLKEAVELYFDNEDAKLEYHEVGNALIGEAFINA